MARPGTAVLVRLLIADVGRGDQLRGGDIRPDDETEPAFRRRQAHRIRNTQGCVVGVAVAGRARVIVTPELCWCDCRSETRRKSCPDNRRRASSTGRRVSRRWAQTSRALVVRHGRKTAHRTRQLIPQGGGTKNQDGMTIIPQNSSFFLVANVYL